MRHTFLFLILVLSGGVNASCQQISASYDTLIQQGNSQLQAGNLSQALEIGQRATKLASERWQAYALTGGALMNLKRYEEAADQFSEGIRLAPETKKSQLRDLRKQCVMAESGVSIPATGSTQPSATTATQAEVVLWKSIETSKSQSDFQSYLSQYPNGTFAGLAHNHLDELQAEEKSLRDQQAAQAAADQARREAQERQAAATYQAGTYFKVVYWHGLMAGGWSIAQGKLTISPNGVDYGGEGTPPHHAFAAACSDLEWHSSFATSVVFKVKSTRKTYQLAAPDDTTNQVLSTINQYCGSR